MREVVRAAGPRCERRCWRGCWSCRPLSRAEPPPPPPAPTPFAEIFAQLAGTLVDVVVNISTTQASPPPAAKGGAEAPAGRPGSLARRSVPRFLWRQGRAGRPNGLAPPIASLGSGFIIDPVGADRHQRPCHRQRRADHRDPVATTPRCRRRSIGRDAVTDLALAQGRCQDAAAGGATGAIRPRPRSATGCWRSATRSGSAARSPPASSRRPRATSIPGPMTISCRPTRRSTAAIPAARCSISHGEVIGINTAIYSPSGGSIGIGFAIPSALAEPIIDQLKATGKVERGWIGARIQPVTDDIAESVGLDKGRGAMIASIDPASPAAQAKLQPGDVILSYDGKPVDRSRQLPRLVADTPPDKAGQVDDLARRQGTRSRPEGRRLDPNRPRARSPPSRKSQNRRRPSMCSVSSSPG